MAKLAIKGHATRGKEVIELLEILGGINMYEYYGINEKLYYFISNEVIHFTSKFYDGDICRFTLEEFLEKFPYKVGDKVIYKPLMPEIDVDVVGEIIAMRWDNYLDEVIYTTSNSHVMSAEYFQPYKEETMEEIHIHKIGFNADKAKLVLCEGYEFETKGKEVYVVKKQLKYPKTYKECYKIMGVHSSYELFGQATTQGEIWNYSYTQELLKTINSFHKLRVCRDTYWKIAGKHMGLDKPWEPDWDSLDKKYSIYNYRGNISHDNFTIIDRCVLVFPTEKMRDAFYENFKVLIDECKELL